MNVPDERFKWLVNLYKPKNSVPAFLEVVDIAGLVKCAPPVLAPLPSAPPWNPSREVFLLVANICAASAVAEIGPRMPTCVAHGRISLHLERCICLLPAGCINIYAAALQGCSAR